MFWIKIASNTNTLSFYELNFTLNTSEEKVNTCVAYLESEWGGEENNVDVFAGETYEAFCNGTGTNWGATLEELIAGGYFNNTQLPSLGVVESITYEPQHYKLNTSEESVNACKEYMMDVTGEDGSDAQDGYQSYCEGTGTIYDGYSILSDINNGSIDTDYFIENNILIPLTDNVVEEIEIISYDETCGSDVIIPAQIEGLPVTRIANVYHAFEPMVNKNLDIKKDTLVNNQNDVFDNTIRTVENNFISIDVPAFSYLNITSVVFPNTLRYIGKEAFRKNPLTKISIPNSVVEIGSTGFGECNISELVLGTGITIIGESAFYNNDLFELTIPSNVVVIREYAFSRNPLANINIIGNPYLGEGSLSSTYGFENFKYGGTCDELNSYRGIFGYESPTNTIITSDSNSCQYTNGL